MPPFASPPPHSGASAAPARLLNPAELCKGPPAQTWAKSPCARGAPGGAGSLSGLSARDEGWWLEYWGRGQASGKAYLSETSLKGLELNFLKAAGCTSEQNPGCPFSGRKDCMEWECVRGAASGLGEGNCLRVGIWSLLSPGTHAQRVH